ncbi:hypothetical protein B0H14DRAFT_3905585 [Mycena olivaceomarginata]|nr:hypothetical protein B0H14DRAFT_3905585 [Mycena olivaceomarginata]
MHSTSLQSRGMIPSFHPWDPLLALRRTEYRVFICGVFVSPHPPTLWLACALYPLRSVPRFASAAPPRTISSICAADAVLVAPVTPAAHSPLHPVPALHPLRLRCLSAHASACPRFAPRASLRPCARLRALPRCFALPPHFASRLALPHPHPSAHASPSSHAHASHRTPRFAQAPVPAPAPAPALHPGTSPFTLCPPHPRLALPHACRASPARRTFAPANALLPLACTPRLASPQCPRFALAHAPPPPASHFTPLRPALPAPRASPQLRALLCFSARALAAPCASPRPPRMRIASPRTLRLAPAPACCPSACVLPQRPCPLLAYSHARASPPRLASPQHMHPRSAAPLPAPSAVMLRFPHTAPPPPLARTFPQSITHFEWLRTSALAALVSGAFLSPISLPRRLRNVFACMGAIEAGSALMVAEAPALKATAVLRNFRGFRRRAPRMGTAWGCTHGCEAAASLPASGGMSCVFPTPFLIALQNAGPLRCSGNVRAHFALNLICAVPAAHPFRRAGRCAGSTLLPALACRPTPALEQGSGAWAQAARMRPASPHRSARPPARPPRCARTPDFENVCARI